MFRQAIYLAIGFTLLVATATSAAEGQKIKVEFDAPTPNYAVKITKVYQVGDEVWAISQITLRDSIALQVITSISDEITLDEEIDGIVIHKVLGKSWDWGKDTKTIQFARDADQLKASLKKQNAKLLWQREKRSP